MDLCLPNDFFHPSNRGRLFRDDLGPTHDSGLSPASPRHAFVTGLRDWRRSAATSPAHPEYVTDSEWRPL